MLKLVFLCTYFFTFFPVSAFAEATLELYGNFHAMGVIVKLSTSDDPDENAAASLEYRIDGSSYQTGFPLSRISNTRFAGSLFQLNPGVSYDVRVVLIPAVP